jgi:hypothetical protein
MRCNAVVSFSVVVVKSLKLQTEFTKTCSAPIKAERQTLLLIAEMQSIVGNMRFKILRPLIHLAESEIGLTRFCNLIGGPLYQVN